MNKGKIQDQRVQIIKDEDGKRLEKSHCQVCGKAYMIEHDSGMTTRADRIRVYPEGEEDPGICSYYCRECLAEIAYAVPGAENRIEREHFGNAREIKVQADDLFMRLKEMLCNLKQMRTYFYESFISFEETGDAQDGYTHERIRYIDGLIIDMESILGLEKRVGK